MNITNPLLYAHILNIDIMLAKTCIQLEFRKKEIGMWNSQHTKYNRE